MRFRYYILGLLATFTFSLQLNNKLDSFDLSNGRSLEDMDLEDRWEDSEEMWVIYVPNQASSCSFVSRATESDLRSVTPLSKRVLGSLGLNTACWKAGRTYTMTPLQGLVVSTFLQPGGNEALGYTVSWAAENALNAAVRVVLTYVLPNNGDRATLGMTVEPGAISPTTNWNFPAGSTNFQVAAVSLSMDLKQG
jgi:hypothetical protein